MWYILQVIRGRETSRIGDLQKALGASADNIFSPHYVCMRRYEGAWHTERKLLFPSYIFVDSAQPDTVKERIMRLSGVAPASSGGLFPIQPAEQEFLQGLLSPEQEVGFSVGDLRDGKLVIASGPLAAYTESVRRIDRHKRLAEVEYTLWGEKRRMKVGLEIRSKDGGMPILSSQPT